MSAVIRGAAAVVLFGTVLSCVEAGAAEWTAQAEVNQSTRYDDNPRLRTTDKEDALAVSLVPELTLRGRSEVLDFALSGRVEATEYVIGDINSTADPILELSTRYQQKRGRLDLQGRLSRRTTLVSETVDTGETDDERHRNEIFIGPGYQYQLTAVDVLRLAAGFTYVTYSGDDDLSDYGYYSGSVGWSRQLDPTKTFDVDVFAAAYDPQEEDSSPAKLGGLQVGVTYEPSARLNLSAHGGLQYVLVDQEEGGDDGSMNWVLEIEGTYRFSPRTSATFSASHQVDPSGSGEPIQRDSLSFSVGHDLTHRTRISLASSIFHNSAVADEEDDEDLARYFLSIEPRITYVLAREWSVAGAYRYNRLDRRESGVADSNAVFLTFTYRPEPWALRD